MDGIKIYSVNVGGNRFTVIAPNIESAICLALSYGDIRNCKSQTVEASLLNSELIISRECFIELSKVESKL